MSRKYDGLHRALMASAAVTKALITHYAEGPRFCRGMNAPSATGCRISILRLIEPKVDFGAADICRRGSTEAANFCRLLN